MTILDLSYFQSKGNPKPPRCFLVISSPCFFHGEVQVAESSSMDGSKIVSVALRQQMFGPCWIEVLGIEVLGRAIRCHFALLAKKAENRIKVIVCFAACSPMVGEVT